MKRSYLVAAVCGCMFANACYDLDVTAVQPVAGTTYTRAEILADPVLIERVVAGTFVNLWRAVGDASPWIVFGVWGEELTTSAISVGTESVWDRVSEPRGAFDNLLGNQAPNPTAKIPWAYFYEANAASAEFGGIVKRENIRIIDPATGIDNTERLLAFAKFVQGLAHIHLGLIFDSAAIVTDEVDLSRPRILPLYPYTEVVDSGIKWLEEAIEMATVNTFTFPLNEGQWVYNVGFDNTQLRAVAHAYIARALVYQARTPEERQAVEWDRVKQHVALATTVKFGPRGEPDNGGITYDYKQASTSAPTSASIGGVNICGNSSCELQGTARVDLRIVGPSDTSGAYQTWLLKVSGDRFDTVTPITVSTPDKRIQEAGSSTPRVKPAFFKHTAEWPQQTSMDTAVRGKYYVSFYWNSTRARDNYTQYPNTGGGNNNDANAGLNGIKDDMLLPVEMDFLLAEAHMRSNPPDLAAAVQIINRTRETNGELRPVTTAGVPVTSDCVPRRWDGTCGDLWDALVYEKRLETYGTAIAFFDARGWGCLLEGTPTQLPIPSTQLDIMRKPSYTFGGNPGQVGSASKPTNCPLLFRP
jgi:hypothetical protein